ncbi:nuclear transport factor 2 family protein [bacterium]|nr:nuclear transport factor 2 family protein [bacterium]
MSDRRHLRALVEGYARAKCRADVDGALAFCHPDFQLETVGFGLASRDRAETAAHLRAFFRVFPDYGVTVDEMTFAARAVACWGTARMTMRGDLPAVPASGRTASLPFVSTFAVADGLLVGERFFFDLATLCDQLGVSLVAVREALHLLRAARPA